MIANEPGLTYERLRARFRWCLPERYNLGVDVAAPERGSAPAVIATDGERITGVLDFAGLHEQSNRLANALRAFGIRAGDRVAIVLPQRFETAIAHVAVYKLGAIAVPLSVLFGPEALELRLRNSGAAMLIAERRGLELAETLGYDLPTIDVDREFEQVLTRGSIHFEAAETTPNTPAVLIYTSGTTGPPKGALHGHRILLGHLPGMELHHDFLPQPGDRLWTPADWAWIGGLFDVLFPALHHGVPVVAYRAEKFDPDRALNLVDRLEVRNMFAPPTALRMMRHVRRAPVELRSVASGGESVGEELIEWGRQQLGATINEFYGQTEANLVIGNCAALMPIRPGWIGKAVPGHEVTLIDGEIAVRAEGDPVVMLGYWSDDEATASKIADGWVRTGDLAEADDDGSFRFIGRADDVISSGGYRIGPGEIEDCLTRHDAVSLAAVVGVPDAVRGEVVKAYVVLSPGLSGTDELRRELQSFVRERLAAYEYPRLLEFVGGLPLTATGKIRRGELRRRHAADT